jgi:hypothetical protein
LTITKPSKYTLYNTFHEKVVSAKYKHTSYPNKNLRFNCQHSLSPSLLTLTAISMISVLHTQGKKLPCIFFWPQKSLFEMGYRELTFLFITLDQHPLKFNTTISLKHTSYTDKHTIWKFSHVSECTAFRPLTAPLSL